MLAQGNASFCVGQSSRRLHAKKNSSSCLNTSLVTPKHALTGQIEFQPRASSPAAPSSLASVRGLQNCLKPKESPVTERMYARAIE